MEAETRTEKNNEPIKTEMVNDREHQYYHSNNRPRQRSKWGIAGAIVPKNWNDADPSIESRADADP